LFFLSGGSALIYEIVWQRALNLVFGVSTLSVSAVLAAFMGGLALGGLLFGRRADRTRHPLRLYALLELGIAVTGMLVPIALSAVSGLSARFPAGGAGYAITRLLLSLCVLGVPTTFLGATLPVMSRLMLRHDGKRGSTFSLLYAVNTLGAVIGAALTGLLLLRVLGLRQTLWIAAGINGFTACSAILLSRWTADWSAPIQPVTCERTSPPLFGLIMFCAGLTGALSTGLEVVWSRILGIITSNSAYGFALILIVVLFGLFLGSLLNVWWSRRPGSPWRRLALCQLLLAAITVFAQPYFHTTPEWLVRWCVESSPTRVFLGELLLTAAALFVPALLMGTSLPLLAGMVVGSQDCGKTLGRIYAVNTLGCAVGPFFIGFVLIPRIGIHGTLGVCFALSIIVALVGIRQGQLLSSSASNLTWWVAGAGVFGSPGAGQAGASEDSSPGHPQNWVRRSTTRKLVSVIASAGILALCAGWFLVPAGRYLKSPVESPRQLLYYAEGDSATVAVIEEPNGPRSILVDGQPVAGTGGTSIVDQKMLAHLPLLLHPSPKRALTVGFGSGGTSYSMTLHGIDVDCVEIESRVPGAAEHFDSEHHGILRHPHFRLMLDDARGWLRAADCSYDVIVTDCTNIQYRSNADLYTTDYFRLMRDRLSADGIAAAWVPANGIHAGDLKTLLRSFRTIFPHTSIWFMNTLPTDFLIVIGTPRPLHVDLGQWQARMQAPDVYADLATVGLADAGRLAFTLLTAGDELDTYLGAGPLHTDDRPILAYSTYGAAFRQTIAANLIELLACRVDPGRFVEGAAESSAILRQHAARNEILFGHLAHWTGDEQTALAHYLRGSALLPEDGALARLVGIAERRCAAR
jgi:spermidine synthase